MKKIINPLVLLFMCIFSLHISAQKVAIGVRGGISIPNLTAGGNESNPLNTGYSSRLASDFGIFAEYKVSKLLSIQPMIEYSAQGGKKNGFQALTTPDEFAAMFPPGMAPAYLYANYKSEAKLDYLLLPLLAKFGWNFSHSSPLRVYVDAGPYVGLLVSARQVTKGSSSIYADAQGQQPLTPEAQSFNNTENIKDQLHKGNFGFEGNVGLRYSRFANNVFIEGGANYGLLNIQKGAANGKNNTGAATVTIGVSHWFGKS